MNHWNHQRYLTKLIGMVIGVAFMTNLGTSQDSIDASQVAELIEKIQSDSYASREVAYDLLLPHPDEAMGLVEIAISKVDQDASARLIRLLGAWSARPDDGFGRVAWKTLQRLAEGGITNKSQLARYQSMAISLEQSEIAEVRLRALSAFIGADTVQIVTAERSNIWVLRIDDMFRGTADDLLSARWLISPELVRLDGERINRDWLEKIIDMPSVRIVQLRHTSLTPEDIQLLRRMKSLDTLEILYMPIDDSAVDVLGSLPIWGSIRIFGTNMTTQAAKRLETVLEGTQVVFGRGGFLGIHSNAATLEISRVSPGSGADKGGLMIEDKITAIDGKPLRNFEELRKELAKSPAGAEVVIEVRRYERDNRSFGENREPVELKLPITLGEQ